MGQDSFWVILDLGQVIKSWSLAKLKIKSMETVVDTMVYVNKMNAIMKQGVRSYSRENNICSSSFDSLLLESIINLVWTVISFKLHI